MYRTVFVGTLLLGGLLTFLLLYEAPMLQRLSVPYAGHTYVEQKLETGVVLSEEGADYTMQAGDVLVGLQEHGLWCPYPEVYAAGKQIEPFEFSGGPYILNYVYSTGDTEAIEIRYISDFYDTVSLNLQPYTYSDLVINLKTLDRRAGYRKISNLGRLDLASEVKFSTYSFSCAGGGSKEYIALTEVNGGTRLTYRKYALDTSLVIPVDYTSYLRELQPALRATELKTGACTTTLYYDVKGANGIVSLEDGSCSSSLLESMLADLRTRVQPVNGVLPF